MDGTTRQQEWPDGRPLPENLLAGAREMADLIENGQLFTFEQRLRQDYNSMWIDDFRTFLEFINKNLSQDEKRTNRALPRLDVLDERYNFHLPLQLVTDGRPIGKSVLDHYSRSTNISSAYESFKDDYFQVKSCLEMRQSAPSMFQRNGPQCLPKLSSYEEKRDKMPIELRLD